MIMGIFAGCGEKSGKEDKEEKFLTVVDEEGTEIKVLRELNRIVSTALANTEILISLGRGEKLAAM